MSEATSIIGVGLMGTAIAERLLSSGRPVIVWNRTASKCKPLAELGARVAETAADAISCAATAILVTANTEDVFDLFDVEAGLLAGKSVINLITGSPRQIRELGERVERSGACFISGTIQCYPSNIGSADATILLGGPADGWLRQEGLLRELAGAAAYLGDRVDMPNVVDAGCTAGFFFSAMAACLEATSYAQREGVSVAEFRPHLQLALQLLPAQIEALLTAVEQRNLGTAEATLDTFDNVMGRFRSALADVGAPDLLMAANHRRIEKAVAAGDGQQGFAALIKY